MPDPVAMSPERLAELAQQFIGTEFGKELMTVMRTQHEGYIKLAKDITSSHETKVSAIERAAGISEVIDFVDQQLLLAEHPEYFNMIQKTIDN